MDQRRPTRPARAVLRLARVVATIIVCAILIVAFFPLQAMLQTVVRQLELALPATAGAGARPDVTPVADAIEQSPDQTFDVAATLAQSASAARRGYVTIRLQAQISAPVGNPLVEQVRAGAAESDSSYLMGALVGGTIVRPGPPVVRLRPPLATIVLTGETELPSDELRRIDWYLPYSCDKIATRQLAISLVDFPVTAVRTESAQPGCPTGGWTEQHDRDATFTGMGTASVDVAGGLSDTAGLSDVPQHVVDLAHVWSTLSYAVLSTLPFVVVLYVLRRRLAPRRTVRRIAGILVSLIALHLVIRLAPVLDAVNVSGVLAALSPSALLHLFPPIYVAPSVLLVAIAYAWRRSSLRRMFARPSAAASVLLDLIVVAISAGAAVAVVLAAGEDGVEALTNSLPAAESWYLEPADLAAVVIVGLVITSLCGFAIALLVGAGAVSATTVAATVAAAGALTMIAPLRFVSDLLGMVISVVPPIVAGCALWLALDRLLRAGLNADPPARWQLARTSWRGLRWLRLPIALLLSIPIPITLADLVSMGWYSFSELTSSLDLCLRLATVFLVVIVLRGLTIVRRSAHGPRATTEEIRVIAIAVAVVGLLNPTVTVGGLPLAFLVGWLLLAVVLLPSDHGLVPLVAGPRARNSSRAAVEALARTAAETGIRDQLSRDLRKSLSDVADPTQQDARIRRIAELSQRGRAPSAELRAALSTYGGLPPWVVGRRFAIAGLVIGLPWSIVGLGAVLQTVAGTGPFKLTDAAAGILVFLRFAIAGLVFGVALPLIRGNTGLSKSWWLFVAMAAPALCVALLPNPRAAGALSAAVLQVAQLLSFTIALGLYADWSSFRRAGLGWRQLRQLYHFGGVAVSLSSLTVAVVTATATALGTGAAQAFVDRAFTPPPAVSSPSIQPTAQPTPGGQR